MVEVINKYETIFIVDVTKTEEEVNSIVEKMKSLIESNATVEAVDIWGKRRLAYEIDDKTEGFYVLVSFSSKPEFPKELERVYSITDGIMRYITVRKDAE